MNPALIDALITKYPDQFKNLKYIECGDGWYDIIDRACYLIQRHIEFKNKKDKTIIDFYWTQIKEKFGGLRAYCYNADEFIRGAIDMAESMSYITCEVSGDKGKPRKQRYDSNNNIVPAWIKTLSEAEATKEGYAV